MGRRTGAATKKGGDAALQEEGALGVQVPERQRIGDAAGRLRLLLVHCHGVLELALCFKEGVRGQRAHAPGCSMRGRLGTIA